MKMQCARRYIRARLAPALFVIGAMPVAAHDGDDVPDVLARVLSAVQQGQVVAVTLELTGLGGPVVLVAVSAPAAEAEPMQPVYVDFALDVQARTLLRFAGPPPDVFTLSLNFGPGGAGAIEVTPVPGPVPDPTR